jgi:hypothetical protein
MQRGRGDLFCTIKNDEKIGSAWKKNLLPRCAWRATTRRRRTDAAGSRGPHLPDPGGVLSAFMAVGFFRILN